MPRRELGFCCGFWGVSPAGEGQPQMDSPLPMLCQSQNLGNRMFPAGGKNKIELKIKQAPGHPFCPEGGRSTTGGRLEGSS